MIYDLRCLICEFFIGWALKIAPADYYPSCIEACVDAYHRRGAFEQVVQERPASNN